MKCISYIRVSTSRQSASGLGLDAQRASVDQFCKQHDMVLLREFQEVESGRKNDREVLRDAIAFAKRSKAILLIAKLDRLARSVAFIANLMESGVDFRACDLPEANRLLLHIMAAVAEAEARAIADRTRVALAAAKARGILLGASNPACRNLTREASRRGSDATARNARDAYRSVLPTIIGLREAGRSLAMIAATLNERGVETRNGAEWTATQVRRVLQRAA